MQRKLEEECGTKQKQVEKLESSTKQLSQEVLKGNQIIKKLQGDIRQYHAKV